MHHLITWMIALPMLGALLLAFLPIWQGTAENRWPRAVALATSLLSSVLAFALVASMQSQTPEVQSPEFFQWIGLYAIGYEVGIDGLNVLLVLLIAALFPILIAAEWSPKFGTRGMHALLLLLQSSFFGAVCAQDIFLQFFFWAFTAVPFYFLIGIWGGRDRESAAFRFMASAAVGNALLFAALVLVYYSVEPHTFSLKDLAGSRFSGKTIEIIGLNASVPVLAFALIGAGLALRAAIWPVHGWFIHVAKEAPPAVFAAMAGVMLPVAIYLLMRLGYTLFPETVPSAASVIVFIGAINLVVGSLFALAQTDLRLLLGYFCLAELGSLLLGVGSLESAGAVGSVYHQLVFGLAVAGFGLFTRIVEERVGDTTFVSTSVPQMGGVAVHAPSVALVAGIFVASLLGIPGLGGFVGRSLLYIGGYPTHPVSVFIAALALLLATYYFFRMYRRIFLGNSGTAASRFSDLGIREKTYFFPLVIALVVCGIYPKPLLELVRPTVQMLLSTVK